MRARELIALGAGCGFALGLGIAGMTDPAKVLAFLDLGGDWDASLALVMLGAIAVHASWLRLQRRSEPYLAGSFDAPSKVGLDARLVGGAALFGLGWRASGFCPGPAVVSLVMLAPGTLLFVGGVLLGILAVNLVVGRRTAAALDGSPAA